MSNKPISSIEIVHHRQSSSIKSDNFLLQKLIKNLDKVFSLYIRKRDYKCPVSGKTKPLTEFCLYDTIEYPNARWDERVHFRLAECVITEMHTQNPFLFFDWYTKRYTPDGVASVRKFTEGYPKPVTMKYVLDLTGAYVKKTEELPEPIWPNGRGRKRDDE